MTSWFAGRPSEIESHANLGVRQVVSGGRQSFIECESEVLNAGVTDENLREGVRRTDGPISREGEASRVRDAVGRLSLSPKTSKNWVRAARRGTSGE